jgi:ABC-type glycerol-3-phosphate transport system permease component
MNTFRRLGKYLIVIGALVATLAPIYWMITISFNAKSINLPRRRSGFASRRRSNIMPKLS